MMAKWTSIIFERPTLPANGFPKNPCWCTSFCGHANMRVDKNMPHIELGPTNPQLVGRHVAGYESLDEFLGCMRHHGKTAWICSPPPTRWTLKNRWNIHKDHIWTSMSHLLFNFKGILLVDIPRCLELEHSNLPFFSGFQGFVCPGESFSGNETPLAVT